MSGISPPGAPVSVRQRPRPAPFRAAALRALARRALNALGADGADIRILVVEDGEMERWNRDFLGRAGTTNVISFPEDDPADTPAGRIAGDILVSAPTCLRQTKGWPGTPEERVFYFILHGMIHLMGLDHERGEPEARRMRRLERKVYEAVVRPSAARMTGRRE